MLACGLDPALAFLERMTPSVDALSYLSGAGFDPLFVDWLADPRFAGDVWAVPEGTPDFPGEPLLEVEAPIAEAQIAETFLMTRSTCRRSSRRRRCG